MGQKWLDSHKYVSFYESYKNYKYYKNISDSARFDKISLEFVSPLEHENPLEISQSMTRDRFSSKSVFSLAWYVT